MSEKPHEDEPKGDVTSGYCDVIKRIGDANAREDPGTQPYRVEYVSVPRDLLDEAVAYLGQRRDIVQGLVDTFQTIDKVFGGKVDEGFGTELKNVKALIRRLEECRDH